MEMRQAGQDRRQWRADFTLSVFSGCGELARRPGLSEGGTGLPLTIHNYGMLP